VSDRKLYLKMARDLRENPGQWAAYESTGHCVVSAGPGSGKTKTLTLKLARILAEDVAPPRGVACITYNNECAKELETRLDQLGIEPGGRVFIGTVHSFSLTQIILPYAKTAKLGLPDEFRVATQQEQRTSLEDAFYEVIGGSENPQNWNLRMSNYRRSTLNRDVPEWLERDPQLAQLVEAYEARLRSRGVIDFDDMPLLAVRAFRENEWLQRAILAKYPVLAVDEYQDLGSALHRMVMGLCFSAGIRLFAVGDVDQSIYGFTGADPSLLQQLSERDDVEVVRLRLNYRSGSRIVTASSYALGETRDYEASADANQGSIFFHPLQGTLVQQADHLFSTLLPEVQARMPSLQMGDVAILYPTAAIGDTVNQAAREHGYETIRTDGNAIYPRSSRLMRWLELCAIWCCGGWRSGDPRFHRIASEGRRLFSEAMTSDEKRLAFQRELMRVLWSRRDQALDVYLWLIGLRSELLDARSVDCRTLNDEFAILSAFVERVGPGGNLSGMALSQFSGEGLSANRINLSTLHSAKGREFRVVGLFAMDQGRIPWNNVGPRQVLESRRLFYVGFTRAKAEIHMIYSANSPSAFVTEVQNRLAEI
jgi:DNA helicase-2/ATP-dependent DNA helicase PcrA